VEDRDLDVDLDDRNSTKVMPKIPWPLFFPGHGVDEKFHM